MEYQKKEIRIFQNGRTVNDQFYIDGDYNVPEAKRDVGKIILSNGDVAGRGDEKGRKLSESIGKTGVQSSLYGR